MSTQPTILAAVDLDARALDIIAHAAHLAALCQGRLILVHVVDYRGGHEPDQHIAQRPGVVLEAMVRYARASLVGMAARLDLPADRFDIKVETGPLVETLTDLALALKPTYCALGQSRSALSSHTAHLAEALDARTNCQLLVVAGQRRGTWRHVLAGARRRIPQHWVASR